MDLHYNEANYFIEVDPDSKPDLATLVPVIYFECLNKDFESDCFHSELYLVGGADSLILV